MVLVVSTQMSGPLPLIRSGKLPPHFMECSVIDDRRSTTSAGTILVMVRTLDRYCINFSYCPTKSYILISPLARVFRSGRSRLTAQRLLLLSFGRLSRFCSKANYSRSSRNESKYCTFGTHHLLTKCLGLSLRRKATVDIMDQVSSPTSTNRTNRSDKVFLPAKRSTSAL